VTDVQYTAAWETRAGLRPLDLSAPAGPCIPHSGWMHFADLVLRDALPHAARYDWAIGDCSFDEIERLATRSGRGEGVRTALLDLGNELGAEAWAYLSIGAGGVSVWIGAAERRPRAARAASVGRAADGGRAAPALARRAGRRKDTCCPRPRLGVARLVRRPLRHRPGGVLRACCLHARGDRRRGRR
jgi:hypothetical protein